MPVKHPVWWNYRKYNSKTALARQLRVSESTVRRFQKAYPRKITTTKQWRAIQNKNQVVWDGITYKSKNELANTLNVSESTIRRWIKQGLRGNADVEAMRMRHAVTWDGVVYPSCAALATMLGKPQSTVKAWVARGFTTTEEAKAYSAKFRPNLQRGRKQTEKEKSSSQRAAYKRKIERIAALAQQTLGETK